MGVVRRLLTLAVSVGVLAAGLTAASGPPAVAAERSCSARTALVDRPRLVSGDTGLCVRTLQNLLMTKGHDLGHRWPGGTFTSDTLTAVKAFQTRAGLPVTGVVNRATWEALAAADVAPGYHVGRGPNASDKVVLSFDDCPRSLSSFKATVRAAEDLGLGLVLFPTGACIRSGRFDAAYARTHGHYVFNHTINHPDLRDLSYTGVYRELGSPGIVTTFGRPPYGATDATARKAYAARSMRVWLWTYDSRDYQGSSRDTLVKRVLNNATAGSTILMHMQWNAFNTVALTRMRDGLAARGLQVCANVVGTTPAAPAALTC